MTLGLAAFGLCLVTAWAEPGGLIQAEPLDTGTVTVPLAR
jgi:hypothetical protein